MNEGSVLSIDQGTSSTKGLLVDHGARLAVTPIPAVAIDQTRPRLGWVEQDPDQIADSVLSVLRTGLELRPGLAAVGLSTQRESALVWDRRTGEALGPMLGWQDRRTAGRAEELTEVRDEVRRISGLPLDPMFSALKFAWLLDEFDPDRRRASAGELVLGTVDAWLVRRLTGRDQIELGNASRTQLLDVRRLDWSPELLSVFNIPRAALPELVPSDTPTPIREELTGGRSVEICGVLGDSHAALFGHGVRTSGDVKVTYGTGSSIMGLSELPVAADSGLVETIGWQIQGVAARAFEGNILSTGHTLTWLAEILGIAPKEVAQVAAEASADHQVDFVPAFAGLGAPWWRADANAVICGFDLGTRRADLCRAAVESIPLQVEDVLARADEVGGTRIQTIRADGGPSGNDWLMQLQADLSRREVSRPVESSVSALGAAHLASVVAGLCTGEELRSESEGARFHPDDDTAEWAAKRTERWLTSLRKSFPA